MNDTNPIATIAHPSSDEFRRVVVTQTHYAREMLGLAERSADKATPKARVSRLHAEAGLHAIRAVVAVLPETDGNDDALRMETLMKRAMHACEAAIGHIDRYRSYEKEQTTKLERDMLGKLRPIWRRSAAEARKDVHRALLLMCERWPDSYEKEALGE